MGILTAVFILILCCMLNGARSSSGDVDMYFVDCVHNCQSRQCTNELISSQEWKSLSTVRYPPLGISLIPWNCFETCEYHCMSTITQKRESYGFGPLKYYGHWPFSRLFGLEEPASALFSLLNLVPHALMFKYGIPKYFSSYPLRRYIALYAALSVNAWFASALYHSKKMPWTTTYDLASALTLLCCSLLLALRKLFGNVSIRTVGMLGNGITFFLLYRLARMFFFDNVSFDEHMNTCMGIVVVTTILWVLWILSPLVLRRALRSNHYLCILVQVWFVAAAMLEVFDFPPYFQTFDAHALWHAATVPLGFVWYYFWYADSQDIKKIH